MFPHFYLRRQRQTRQATLFARRPIEETEEEMKETKDQLKLTEKEEQKAQKMSAFMQRYQEFKKDKGTSKCLLYFEHRMLLEI